MLYPENFEQKTGFDKVRGLLAEKCISSLGRQYIQKIRFHTRHDDVTLLLQQTEEFRQIIMQGTYFPASNYFDHTGLFAQLRLEGTYAEPDSLLEIRLTLDTLSQILTLLRQPADSGDMLYPALSLVTDGLAIPAALPRQIDLLIDEKAEVRSSASPELARIRHTRQEFEKKAARRINQILHEAKSQGWIAQDIELALRNGRQVIPVAAAYKRKLRGFIHDQSATGQTVFLEPEEVFTLNNQVRELEFEERQEVVRLLKEFADFLRPELPMLIRCYEMLGAIDAIRAKAKLAIDMDAFMPKLTDKPQLQWVQARHPLLYLTYKALKKHVEPFSIELHGAERILIISGPNAGGKSVCLKACGLIQYMLQCGLLVPMAEYSETGLFDRLFIDIGDEQSLENDLSTYSSHLLNMRYFVTNSNHRTLFLIDEFGTGTEPRIGGALAESVLEMLNRRKALGVVTTHYANLKVMAGKHKGLVNGSMLFDTRLMKPLFRLKMGSPGSSFAFEIAKTIGLPDELLSRASEIVGSEVVDFDRELQDMELKKIELEQKEKELRTADAMLTELIDKYEALHSQVESKKSEILIHARQEAKAILQGANKIIENTIREIRENQARQEETRAARRKLDTYISEQGDALLALRQPRQPKIRVKAEREPGPIRVGDYVRIAGQQSMGEVMDIQGNQATIALGSIKLRSPLNRLEKIRKDSIPEQQPKSKIKLSFDINEKAASFNPQIDLRGDRAEEAMTKLKNYLDDCLLLHVKQAKILHGKGDGILRQLVREYLSRVTEVHRFRDEHPDRGGAGATVVDFS